MKPSEDQEANSPISYIPWTKTDLWIIIQDFPKVSEHPFWFAKEFNIVIQIDQSGFSDLYQSVYMLAGEGQAQHWMKMLSGKILKCL